MFRELATGSEGLLTLISGTAGPWASLPRAPGVYKMVDSRGRILYVGRSGDLRTRVRSYWSSADPYRPDLKRMVARVRSVDHVECVSEHEAAFLERELIGALKPPFNRTYGVEAVWWLELCADADNPHLAPVRTPAGEPRSRYFGPYLGGRPVRLIAAALARLYPVQLCAATLHATGRDLARARGVGPADLETTTRRIAAVLEGKPQAVMACQAELAAQRDRAAASELFEKAAELQETIRAVGWLTQARGRFSASAAAE